MKRFAVSICILLCSLPAMAQQTGAVFGTVKSADGAIVPGVSVEATGDVLPRPRLAMTDAAGAYGLQLLPPGNYELKFSLAGFTTVKRSLKILLQQNATLNVTIQVEGVTEELIVTSASAVIDVTSPELKTAIDDDVISQVPVGQEYRDLVKLIPGVQYTEDTVRGPSAGGSGQDNVYQFDGVNVTLPLFGTLSAEPSSHDIAQISIVKGGAKARDFNRSGGFTINTISKSGTNRFRGEVSYQVQTEDLTGERDNGSNAQFEEDKDWAVFNLGGPIISDRIFFYTSYYRPTTDRGNRSNLYGAVPDAERTREEYFGKLSLTPTASMFLNLSYRDSDNTATATGVIGGDEAGSTSNGTNATLEILSLEGSWVLSDRSFLSFKVTDFVNETFDGPDNLFNFGIAVDGSVALDVNNLDQQGLFLVPQPLEGEDAYNAFIAPLISEYGFQDGGMTLGGGEVGGGSTISDQDFTRESFEIAFDTQLGDHELHFGYQAFTEEEDLSRTSNGWGGISVPGGRLTINDIPIFYEARFEQQSLLSPSGEVVPPIRSSYEGQSFEVNDTWRLDEWTLNLGLVVSNDQLFGQGLKENSNNVSGFELAPGHKYKMYEVDFDDMIQPRLGVIRSLEDGRASVYASYSKYHPAANSLPRAASWGRNNRRSIRGFFDIDGNLVAADPVGSSSGKFFAEGLEPRAVDEYVVGYSKQVTSHWTTKVHARYRYGAHFWEDTNNNARQRFEPPEGIPQDLYIPELDAYRAEVGGSSYVIAELDDAYTKYYEGSFDAEWRGEKAYFKGSYVWSHYYGNFDQDNTTTSNDAASFVGSSFIADGAGRQLWNFREGNLRGDRRHQLKAYGYYHLNWDASVGFYAIYQSGQPWEAWDVEVYRHLTGSSSDTSRFAEPAGSRTTSDHHQVDLNYTQNFPFGGDRYNVQLRADIYNTFDNQTGYNIQNKRNSSGFGDPRSYFNPRRIQLSVRFQF
jgi:hypothetical protein